MTKYLLLFILFLPLVGQAQESDLGNWIIAIGSKQLNERFNIHGEVQYRNYNAIGDLEQLLLRTGIGYNLTENNNNLLLGYGFIQSENYALGTDEKTGVAEHRIFQQFITKQKFSRVKLTHRYRFEQRFVEDDFRLRFRYFLASAITLNKDVDAAKPFYLSIYNEIFLNTEQTVFDRNRLYGGLGYKPSKKIRAEIGYMNQFFSQGGRDQINLILFLSL